MSASTGLVIEDQDVIRGSMRRTLEAAFPGIRVDESADLRGARALLAAKKGYGVVLVDLGLPDGSGVELIRELRKKLPQALIVVSTIYDDDDHLFPALAAGATGYLLKDQSPEALLRHLRQLEEEVPPLSPSIARRVLAYFHGMQSPPSPLEEREVLAPREVEVLSLIGRGLRVGEVASLLGLTENTVASYVKEIYRKLNIGSRAEAAIEASRRGLL